MDDNMVTKLTERDLRRAMSSPPEFSADELRDILGIDCSDDTNPLDAILNVREERTKAWHALHDVWDWAHRNALSRDYGAACRELIFMLRDRGIDLK